MDGIVVSLVYEYNTLSSSSIAVAKKIPVDFLEVLGFKPELPFHFHRFNFQIKASM